jgi:antitoxin HigA-1
MVDFAPTHPGKVLLSEFIKPMGISQNRIARAIDASSRRNNGTCTAKRGITADAARLSGALV